MSASDYRRQTDRACFQMRLSYSPAAHLFLFLVQWTDCYLAGALGFLRILIYMGLVKHIYPMTDETLSRDAISTIELVVAKYIPEDITYIEQVNIPLFVLKSSHWFLVVIDIVNEKCFVLDSMETMSDRVHITLDVLKKASEKYADDTRLGRILKGVTKFSLEIPKTNKQQHEIESAMYMIKYIEALHYSEWSEIKYTADQIRVERLKSVVKWVNSKYNSATPFEKNNENITWHEV